MVEFRLFQASQHASARNVFHLCDRPDYRLVAEKQNGNREILAEPTETKQLHGFIFSPDPDHPETAPRHYEFQTSSDGKSWKTVVSGEFANLHANPIPQVVEFPARQLRSVRFRAADGSRFDCAAFGLLEN